MSATLVEKLRATLPKAMKHFPGKYSNRSDNNRLETIKLLLIYLNKCLVGIAKKSGDEILIQEALDIFDSFVSFFITLESELILLFLRSDFKEMMLVIKQTIVILLESNRLYFHDVLLSLTGQFISRMRFFGQLTILNLYYCEKLFSGILKEISKIDLVSIQVAKAFVQVFHQLLKLLPLSAIQDQRKKKLKLFQSPVSFLRNILGIIFQVPFLFEGIGEISSIALKDAATDIKDMCCEKSLELEMKSEVVSIVLFSLECSAIFSFKKKFLANDLLKCFHNGLTNSLFKGFVLPFVLLSASLPYNHLECESFFNQVPDCHKERTTSALVGLAYKRIWDYELLLPCLSLTNIRRFALKVLSQKFTHDGATFLIAMLDLSKKDISCRLEICKCLAQISINESIGGNHYCFEFFECFKSNSNFDTLPSFFTSLLRYTGGFFGGNLEEQESLGLWAFAITKHITTCAIIKDNPHCYQSISDCFLRLIAQCQMKKNRDILNQTFFITWGILLGSGSLSGDQISKLLDDEEKLDDCSCIIPPCATSTLHLSFEVLLLLRKCPFVEIRIRVLGFCKILIGNIPQIKVIETNYSELKAIYALVLGIDTINISSYAPFDSLENEKKIMEMIIEILDFGYYYHYITFHPRIERYSKVVPSIGSLNTINATLADTNLHNENLYIMNREIESFMPSNFFQNNNPQLEEKMELEDKKEEKVQVLETSLEVPELSKLFPNDRIDKSDSQRDLQAYDKSQSNEWMSKPDTELASEYKKSLLSKDNDDIMRYEDLAVGESSNIIEEFISTNTKDSSIFNDNNLKSDYKEESILNAGESFLIQQSALIKLPFAKRNITKSIPLMIRHLIFSKNDNESIDYFRIYSHGLLCGSLQLRTIDLKTIPFSKGVKPLHPMIKSIASLDMHIILELLQDFEMQNLTIQDELFSWICGLTDVHRHLLSLSRSIHEVEYQLKRDLTIAECLVMIRDKLSIIKLSINNSLLTEADIDKLGSADNLGIEKSRVKGSMILLEDNFSKWLSYLL